jgi:hypothetical protein
MSYFLQNHGLRRFEPPEIKVPDLPMHHMWSDTQFEIIKQQIQQYEETLDEEHEVGVMLTNFGQSIVMQVTEISYEESVVLIFKGYVNGVMSTLIQHINQLSFLLTSVEKEPEREKRKIGFAGPDEK